MGTPTLEEIDRVIAEGNAWHKSIPIFAVYPGDSRKLGNCYNSYGYRVESRYPLTREMIDGLRKAGFFAGQEFYDRTPSPTPTRVETFRPTGINPRDGRPYPERKQTVYVYNFESRVDSSD